MKIDSFEKEIIGDIYSYAMEGKSNCEIILAEIGYPAIYKKKAKALAALKKEGLIKKYRLVQPQEFESQPPKLEKHSELEIELNPELLTQQAAEDYDVAYLYNALVDFYPKKIIKRYKEIFRREEIEKAFKYEVELTCGELRFGLDTGNAIYRETITNFRPESKEYCLLKDFLEHPNRKRSTKELAKILYPAKQGALKWSVYSSKVKDFVNKIRKKLEMYGASPKNKDLFEPCNGYRIRCKKK